MRPLSLRSSAETAEFAKRRRNPARLPVRVADEQLAEVKEGGEYPLARSCSGSPLDAKNDNVSIILDPKGRVKHSVAVDDRYSVNLPSYPRDRFKELQTKFEQQKSELFDRCVQIADLSNVQQQQAEALLLSRDVIANLDKSVSTLREQLAQQERELIENKKALSQSNERREQLQSELESLQKESVELLRKNLDLSAAYNDREVAIVIAEEKYASLKGDLTAKTKENATLLARIEELTNRCEGERDERCVLLESRVEELIATLSDRDGQIDKLNGTLGTLYARCVELGHETAALDGKPIFDEMATQARTILALEFALLAEREVAQQKISELADELERARAEQFVTEAKSAMMRKEIARLLPKLASAG